MTVRITVSGRSSPMLLALALLTGLWASGGVQALNKPWCSVIDTALVGWNISLKHTATHKLCHQACLDTPGCQSANYWYRDKLCQLNNASHWNLTGRGLVEKDGSVYTVSQKETDDNLYTAVSCHGNVPNMTVRQWCLVFKGMAGTGVKLYDIWTSQDWNSSYDDNGHRRDNALYRAWRTGQLNIRRVKLSLYDSTGVRAELIFNGTGSDIKSWFTQTRLISSPWEDLKSAPLNTGGPGQFFSIDGHKEEDRRFYINNNYRGCSSDRGWLVVVESAALADCDWEGPTEAYPFPLILYSVTKEQVTWNDLVTQAGLIGRADSLTIHIDVE